MIQEVADDIRAREFPARPGLQLQDLRIPFYVSGAGIAISAE